MDAVDLAKEFAEDCLEGATAREHLEDWLYFHDSLEFSSWDEVKPILKQVKVVLDSRIIITINE
jgi:hypothetical protein